MSANMLDTHTLIKRLTQAGVPEAQAEAHMSVFLDMSERGFATKGDIEKLHKRMDGLSDELREVKIDIKTLKGDVAELKGDVVTLKGEVFDVKTGLTAMNVTLSGMEMRLMFRLGGLMVTLMTLGIAILKFTPGQ
ncbi:hypothetical protein [Acidiferrobacter sp.]|uniref:hypothetical protein n=1 Tax=Acidiferrobacter sp. TaxID=1872107 RepID=UPI0026136E63|nr:hypothetical protein [Acidiferrobacter sp.]